MKGGWKSWRNHFRPGFAIGQWVHDDLKSYEYKYSTRLFYLLLFDIVSFFLSLSLSLSLSRARLTSTVIRDLGVIN